MPIVQMPDGVRVNFPDSMSREDIKAAILSKYPNVAPQGQQVMNGPEVQEGAGRTALEQGLQGATFGFADEISDRLGAGIASLLTDEDYDSLLQEARRMSQARGERQSSQLPEVAIPAQVAGSLLTGGAGMATKGGAALAKTIASGGLPSRIAKGAAAGAVSGGLYGAGGAQEGERLAAAEEAALTGAALGGASPAAGEVVRSTILPKVDEAIQPLARKAREFGIPLSIDQVAPSRARNTLKKVSQKIPLSGVGQFEDKQRAAFNKAVAKTIGQDADDLSPKVIKAFKRDAEKKFGNAVIGKDIPVTSSDLNALEQIYNNAETAISSDLLSIVRKNIDTAVKDLGTPDLKGAKLASLRSSLIKKLPRVQGEAKEYVGDIVEVIDDIAERVVTPSKMTALKEARREWRNYKTIEPLLEKATKGQINPTMLQNRVAQSKFIRAAEAEVGEDDLVDLARIGKELLPISGGSDTFEQTALATGVVGSAFEPTTGALLAGTTAANRVMQELNRLSPRVAAAVEKGGARFIPESLKPALLAGLVAAEQTKNEEKQ